MARYILVYGHPSLGEQRFPLEEDRTYRLGARGDNDIVIPQQDVSRHHAVITVSGGKLRLTDLDSKNGSFVNGVREASCELHGGDQIGLSSASLMVVEAVVDSGGESPSGEVAEARTGTAGKNGLDTTQHRLGASPDDLVALLEMTGAAVARGGVTAPLDWAVERLGADAALVAYRDPSGNVAIVASEGDLTGLVSSHADLVRMAADRVGGNGGEPSLVSQEEVSGCQMVVARLDREHLLILRCPFNPPSVGDLRALVAAQNAVLAAARRESGSGPGTQAGGRQEVGATSLRSLLELPLAEGREAFERLRVEHALKMAGGSWTDAAVRLGMTRAGLYKLARRLGVSG